MTPRVAWSLTLSLLVPLSGCGLAALGGMLAPTQNLVSAHDEPPRRALTVKGQIRVPETLARQGSLSSAPSMTVSKPFEQVAPISRSSYRVLGFGFGVQAVGDEGPRTEWNPDGTVKFAPVDLINPTTGEKVGEGMTDGAGNFVVRTFTLKGGRAAFIAQAVLRNAKGETAGVLAAPFGAAVVSVPSKSEGVNVSVGTTMLTFSTLLLSDSYLQVDLSKGLVGVKSARLDKLVAGLDGKQVSDSAQVLDQGDNILAAKDFDSLVGTLATSSAVLSFNIEKLGREAGGSAPLSPETEVSLHTAVMTELLGNIVKIQQEAIASPSVSGIQDLFAKAVERIDVAKVQKKAEELAKNLAPKTVPTLPPIPTPTPGNVGVVLK